MFPVDPKRVCDTVFAAAFFSCSVDSPAITLHAESFREFPVKHVKACRQGLGNGSCRGPSVF